MSKKDRILGALAIVVTLVAIFGIFLTIDILLWRLPSPWDVATNIGFGILVLVAMVYLDLGKNEKKMTSIISSAISTAERAPTHTDIA